MDNNAAAEALETVKLSQDLIYLTEQFSLFLAFLVIKI